MNRHQQLISGYLDGELTNDQATELRRWLRADPGHIDHFVLDCYLHWQMYDEICEQRVRHEAEVIGEICPAASEHSDESVLGMVLEQEARARARRENQQREQLERERQEAEERFRMFQLMTESQASTAQVRHIVIPRPVVYVLAGAMAAALVLAVYFGTRPSTPSQPPAPIAIDPSPQPQPVAVAPIGRISAAVGVVWADPAMAVGVGDQLDELERRITAGVIELTFEQGAKVLIEAPATFRPRHAHMLELAAGKVTGEVPAQARGFTVDTPHAAVVDLGTAFGITVDTVRQLTDVHVFDGSVVLTADRTDANAKRILHQGEAQRADADGLQPLAFDDRQHLRAIPSSYELAVRQSDPLAYWKLSDVAEDRVARNRGRVGDDATLPPQAQIVQQMHIDGQVAPSIVFTEEHAGIPVGLVSDWDYRHSFTLEAWVKPLPHVEGNYRILSNRDLHGGLTLGIAGENNTVYAPHMTVLFSFFDVRDFCSAAVVPTDRWSHVVVTVNEHSVPSFFINGERVDTLIRRGESSYVLMDKTSHPFGEIGGSPLYLGANPPPPNGAPANWAEEDAAFRGGLDHIAVYDRPLTEQEIQTHYSIGAGFLRP